MFVHTMRRASAAMRELNTLELVEIDKSHNPALR
jgi:hypothetical protein